MLKLNTLLFSFIFALLHGAAAAAQSEATDQPRKNAVSVLYGDNWPHLLSYDRYLSDNIVLGFESTYYARKKGDSWVKYSYLSAGGSFLSCGAIHRCEYGLAFSIIYKDLVLARPEENSVANGTETYDSIKTEDKTYESDGYRGGIKATFGYRYEPAGGFLYRVRAGIRYEDHNLAFMGMIGIGYRF
jgi:hypothetical protein